MYCSSVSFLAECLHFALLFTKELLKYLSDLHLVLRVYMWDTRTGAGTMKYDFVIFSQEKEDLFRHPLWTNTKFMLLK